MEKKENKRLKFSEFNFCLIKKSEKDSDFIYKIKKILDIFKNYDPNSEEFWSSIKKIVNDDDWLSELGKIYGQGKDYAIEIYEELLQEFSNDIIASSNIIKKIAQENIDPQIPDQTDLGNVNTQQINQDKGGFPDTSEIETSGISSGASLKAIQLIGQTSLSGVMQGINWVGVSSDQGHLGVYETELQGKGFRLNLNRIQSEISELTESMQNEVNSFMKNYPQNVNDQFPDNKEMMQFNIQYGGQNWTFGPEDMDVFMARNKEEIEILVLGEVMVHEATHANGDMGEDGPVSAEKRFLREAIVLLNNKRKTDGVLPLLLGIKGESLASSSLMEKYESNWYPKKKDSIKIAGAEDFLSGIQDQKSKDILDLDESELNSKQKDELKDLSYSRYTPLSKRLLLFERFPNIVYFCWYDYLSCFENHILNQYNYTKSWDLIKSKKIPNFFPKSHMKIPYDLLEDLVNNHEKIMTDTNIITSVNEVFYSDPNDFSGIVYETMKKKYPEKYNISVSYDDNYEIKKIEDFFECPSEKNVFDILFLAQIKRRDKTKGQSEYFFKKLLAHSEVYPMIRDHLSKTYNSVENKYGEYLLEELQTLLKKAENHDTYLTEKKDLSVVSVPELGEYRSYFMVGSCKVKKEIIEKIINEINKDINNGEENYRDYGIYFINEDNYKKETVENDLLYYIIEDKELNYEEENKHLTQEELLQKYKYLKPELELGKIYLIDSNNEIRDIGNVVEDCSISSDFSYRGYMHDAYVGCGLNQVEKSNNFKKWFYEKLSESQNKNLFLISLKDNEILKEIMSEASSFVAEKYIIRMKNIINEGDYNQDTFDQSKQVLDTGYNLAVEIISNIPNDIRDKYFSENCTWFTLTSGLYSKKAVIDRALKYPSDALKVHFNIACRDGFTEDEKNKLYEDITVKKNNDSNKIKEKFPEIIKKYGTEKELKDFPNLYSYIYDMISKILPKNDNAGYDHKKGKYLSSFEFAYDQIMDTKIFLINRNKINEFVMNEFSEEANSFDHLPDNVSGFYAPKYSLIDSPAIVVYTGKVIDDDTEKQIKNIIGLDNTEYQQLSFQEEGTLWHEVSHSMMTSMGFFGNSGDSPSEWLTSPSEIAAINFGNVGFIRNRLYDFFLKEIEGNKNLETGLIFQIKSDIVESFPMEFYGLSKEEAEVKSGDILNEIAVETANYEMNVEQKAKLMSSIFTSYFMGKMLRGKVEDEISKVLNETKQNGKYDFKEEAVPPEKVEEWYPRKRDEYISYLEKRQDYSDFILNAKKIVDSYVRNERVKSEVRPYCNNMGDFNIPTDIWQLSMLLFSPPWNSNMDVYQKNPIFSRIIPTDLFFEVQKIMTNKKSEDAVWQYNDKNEKVTPEEAEDAGKFISDMNEEYGPDFIFLQKNEKSWYKIAQREMSQNVFTHNKVRNAYIKETRGGYSVGIGDPGSRVFVFVKSDDIDTRVELDGSLTAEIPREAYISLMNKKEKKDNEIEQEKALLRNKEEQRLETIKKVEERRRNAPKQPDMFPDSVQDALRKEYSKSNNWYKSADKKITIKDLNKISDDDWSRINDMMNADGYDFRGGEDTKEIFFRLTNRSGGIDRNIFPDHYNAFVSVYGPLGVSDNKRKTDPILQAKKDYGLTNNIYEAGFILPDGSLLDMSGGGSGGRGLDHHEMAQYFPESDSQYEGLNNFMMLGIIRCSFGRSSSMDIVKEPTAYQYRAIESAVNGIEELYLDLSFGEGNKVPFLYGSADPRNNGRVNSKRVINDIKRFYSQSGPARISKNNNWYKKAQQREYVPVFYSKLQRVLEKKLPKINSPKSLLQLLNSNLGVKKEEIMWSGITDWIEGQDRKMEKKEIIDFLDNNNIKLEDVHPILDKELENHLDWTEFEPVENDFDENMFEEYYREAMEKYSEEEDFEEFGGYYDGKAREEANFRMNDEEISMYEKNDREYGYTIRLDAIVDKYFVFSPDGDELAEENDENEAEGVAERDALGNQKEGEEKYQYKEYSLNGEESENYGELLLTWKNPAINTKNYNKHFDAQNVISHARYSSIKDEDKGDVFFIEEIQSDWHQEGRENGYNKLSDKKELDKRYNKIKQSFNSLLENNPDKREWEEAKYRLSSFDILSFLNFVSRNEKMSNEINDYIGIPNYINETISFEKEKIKGDSVDEAPFSDTKSWASLMFKRMARWAAEKDFDGISWTTGEQQAERYSLRKKINEISFMTYREMDGTAYRDRLTVIDVNGRPVFDENYSYYDGWDKEKIRKRMTEVIGKELTERILDKGETKIQGEDIEIGGSGMINFYDTIIPSIAKKIGRQYGVELSRIKIPEGQDKFSINYYLPISRKMKEDILYNGQPLFAKTKSKTKESDMKNWYKVAQNEGKYKIDLDIPIPSGLIDIFETFKRNGYQSLIVGGAVRDAFLGNKSKDIDVEVYGANYESLVKMLKQYGRVDIVGQAFGVIKFVDKDGNDYDFSVPRRDNKIGKGHRGFEMEFDPSIQPKEAASRRDFTINSLAYDPLTHEIHDYFGGIEDLNNKILRATSPAFAEDPLRVLRGMQFASRFGFNIEPETAKMAATLKNEPLVIERVKEEWMKMFTKGKYPSKIIQYLIDTEWIDNYPELKGIVDVEQDSIWHPCGSVDVHTAHVMDAAAVIADERGIKGESRAVLLASALCHDLGKANTTKREMKDGVERVTSHGHAEESVPLTKTFLERIGIQKNIINQVVPLVGSHMKHIDFDEKSKNVNVRQIAESLFPATIEQLEMVIRSDMGGRPPLEGGLPDSAQRMVDLAKEENVYKNKAQPLIQGKDILEIYPSAPRNKFLGEALIYSYKKQLEGSVKNKDQALAVAMNYLRQKISFINGNDILGVIGGNGGPHIGEIINHAWESQIRGEFNNKDEAMLWLEYNYGNKTAKTTHWYKTSALEPWQMNKKDFLGETDPILLENYENVISSGREEDWGIARKELSTKETMWTNSILSAISMGFISVEDAIENGYPYPLDLKKKFKPLPDILYHVTVAMDKVMQLGLKTRDDLGVKEANGLGGGESNSISLTTDIDYARSIKINLVEGARTANGDLSPEEMIKMAKMGTGAKRPYYNEIEKYFESSFGPLKYFLRGKKIENFFIEPVEEMLDKGYSLLDEEDKNVWRGGDGREYSNSFLKDMNEEERIRDSMGLYKAFALFRQEAGGMEYAWFGFNDDNALSKIDVSKIGILELRSKPNTFGTFFPAEREYRVYSGDTVEIIGIVDDEIKKNSSTKNNWYKKSQFNEEYNSSDEYGDDEESEDPTSIWTRLDTKPIEEIHKLEYMLFDLDKREYLNNTPKYYQMKERLELLSKEILNKMKSVYTSWVNDHTKSGWLRSHLEGLLMNKGSEGNSLFNIDIKENVLEKLSEEISKNLDKITGYDKYGNPLRTSIENIILSRSLHKILDTKKGLEEAISFLNHDYFDSSEFEGKTEIEQIQIAKEEIEQSGLDSEFADYLTNNGFETSDFNLSLKPYQIKEAIENFMPDDWWEFFIFETPTEIYEIPEIIRENQIHLYQGPFYYVFEEVAKTSGYDQWASTINNKKGVNAIQKTIKRINDTKELIEDSLSSNDIKKRMIALTIGLNTAHATGGMSQYLGLTERELEELSNLDFKPWDNELKRISKVSKDWYKIKDK